MLPGRESAPVRVRDGLGAVPRADLRQQVVDVTLHRRLADDEALGDADRDQQPDRPAPSGSSHTSTAELTMSSTSTGTRSRAASRCTASQAG